MLSFNQKIFLFWDFDGVIKDSVDEKTCTFVSLFKNFGSEVLNQVIEHHEANSGVSRFEKMPLYLDWAGVKVKQLSLYNCFYEIIGAPTKKIPAIKSIVREFNITTMDAGMIGDSESDMEAAFQNDIDFFLRKTLINKSLQSLYKGPQFENFIK